MPPWTSLILDPTAWVALATLVSMEIVLGVDNLIFVAILTNRVPDARRAPVRRFGLGVALLFRIALLGMLTKVVTLTSPVLVAFAHAFSWRDIVMVAGGLFLVFINATLQVIALDLVFSIDSVVTAVGMTDHISIMIVAVILAVVLMLFAAEVLSAFIERNPTLVMLALSFLLMIGMVLIADGFGVHVPKGYIYTALLFSGAVESLNMFGRSRQRPRAPREG